MSQLQRCDKTPILLFIRSKKYPGYWKLWRHLRTQKSGNALGHSNYTSHLDTWALEEHLGTRGIRDTLSSKFVNLYYTLYNSTPKPRRPYPWTFASICLCATKTEDKWKIGRAIAFDVHLRDLPLICLGTWESELVLNCKKE